MIDPTFLVLPGLISLLIGIVIAGFSSLTLQDSFGEEPRKDYSLLIGIVLIGFGLALLIPGISMQESQSKIEMNELCESIDMEFMKRSNGGLFGNSYVLCYDKSNKEIKEIPL